jgi:hypothetical protein
VHGEAAPRVHLPCGDLSCHVAPPANLPLSMRLYSFLTQFSGKLLEAFWCSKWVIQGIVGKLEKYTFQQCKVCMNRSSDGKVMAPGSWVFRAVFSRFSGEDSDQTRDATGEPRVVSHNWSCSLSQGSKLADQLTASWKESAHEGGYSRGKTRQIFGMFFLFLSVFVRTVVIARNVDFRRSWCP